jgi:hypothetical protein
MSNGWSFFLPQLNMKNMGKFQGKIVYCNQYFVSDRKVDWIEVGRTIMVEIKVDFSGAGKISTGLSVGVNHLRSVSNGVKDNRTTVAGNNEASRVIDQTKMVSEKIAQVIADMSKNLNSVTKEFKAVDDKIGNEFIKTEFTLNG